MKLVVYHVILYHVMAESKIISFLLYLCVIDVGSSAIFQLYVGEI